jgi:hypothetical protein
MDNSVCQAYSHPKDYHYGNNGCVVKTLTRGLCRCQANIWEMMKEGPIQKQKPTLIFDKDIA